MLPSTVHESHRPRHYSLPDRRGPSRSPSRRSRPVSFNPRSQSVYNSSAVTLLPPGLQRAHSFAPAYSQPASVYPPPPAVPGPYSTPPPSYAPPLPLQEDGASKQQPPSLPKSRKPNITYRVRGLPTASTAETAGELLKGLLKVDDVCIESLAKDASGQSEVVATVRFPAEFPEALQSEDEEWSLKLESEDGSSHSSLSFDKHFDGFTPLSDPDSDKYQIDFVAIHGLGGHALGSWKDKKSGHLWIRDTLHRDLGTARILTYGYRAKVVDSESFETIEDMAALFCALFRDIRNTPETSRKPVIFAAHSLGGLILKAALGRMNHGHENDRLGLYCTHGILCFGVPNQGMETSHMLAMIGGQANVPLVLSLSKNPHALMPLNDRFNSAFHFKDSTVVSFYETETSSTMQQGPTGAPEMTGKRVVLVDLWSAQNNRVAMEEPRLPIQRDHSNMVKFSPRDKYYVVVKNQILEIVSNASEVIEKRLGKAFTRDAAREKTPKKEHLGELNGEVEPEVDPDMIEAAPKPEREMAREKPKSSNEEDIRRYQKEIELLKRLNAAHVSLSSKFEREEALIWAVRDGDLDMVEYILERKTDPDTASRDMMTALGIAAGNGHTTLVQLLLSRGADVNALDGLARSALHMASGYGHIAVMRQLILAGALMQQRPLTQHRAAEVCFTPLMNAAKFTQLDAIALLVEKGAKVNAQTFTEKFTALHAAICSKEPEAVMALLDRGADPNLATVRATPLIHSIVHSKTPAARLTIAKSLLQNGADPNSKSQGDFTPLHYATSYKDLDLCKLLLDHGANVNSTGRYGQTSLHISSHLKYTELSDLLKERGADDGVKNILDDFIENEFYDSYIPPELLPGHICPFTESPHVQPGLAWHSAPAPWNDHVRHVPHYYEPGGTLPRLLPSAPVHNAPVSYGMPVPYPVMARSRSRSRTRGTYRSLSRDRSRSRHRNRSRSRSLSRFRSRSRSRERRKNRHKRRTYYRRARSPSTSSSSPTSEDYLTGSSKKSSANSTIDVVEEVVVETRPRTSSKKTPKGRRRVTIQSRDESPPGIKGKRSHEPLPDSSRKKDDEDRVDIYD